MNSILALNGEAATEIYAWARYVFWADVERQQYDAYEPAADEGTLGTSTVLMVHFYAALWVAIEGWRTCGLSDDVVDDLLGHPAFERNMTLLRRFRNGVYHYQPDLINRKILDFLRESTSTVTWAFLVHDEFRRVVWEIAHPPSLPAALQAEFAQETRGLVGWLPEDLPEAGPHEAEERFREVLAVIGDGPRQGRARELLDAANEFRAVAHQARGGWRQSKDAMIHALKLHWAASRDSSAPERD